MSQGPQEVFTEPTDADTLSPDAFVVRHRLPNPFIAKRSKRETITLQTKRKQARFLHAFAQTGLDRDGCQAAGVTAFALRDWRARNETFALLYDAAFREASDRIEREVIRRAVDGWDEPVYQGGKRVGHIRRYDSNLLALLLKGRKSQYREQRLNQTLNTTTNNVAMVPIERLTDEEFQLLGRIMGKRGPSLVDGQKVLTSGDR